MVEKHGSLFITDEFFAGGPGDSSQGGSGSGLVREPCDPTPAQLAILLYHSGPEPVSGYRHTGSDDLVALGLLEAFPVVESLAGRLGLVVGYRTTSAGHELLANTDREAGW